MPLPLGTILKHVGNTINKIIEWFWGKLRYSCLTAASSFGTYN